MLKVSFKLIPHYEKNQFMILYISVMTMCLFSHKIYKAHPQETNNSRAMKTVEIQEMSMKSPEQDPILIQLNAAPICLQAAIPSLL